MLNYLCGIKDVAAGFGEMVGAISKAFAAQENNKQKKQ